MIYKRKVKKIARKNKWMLLESKKYDDNNRAYYTVIICDPKDETTICESTDRVLYQAYFQVEDKLRGISPRPKEYTKVIYNPYTSHTGF